MKKSWLVAFEGLDGSGKSTQLPRLAEALRAEGHAVVSTREPTDGPWGRRIRAAAKSGDVPAPAEELRWFVEDRRQHVAEVIAPALAAGKVVLTDRYFLSSVCYQGARGLDPEQILTDSEAEFPLPDLALILEIEPAAGLARVHERGRDVEPGFEGEAFLERVAANFAALDRDYVVRIDGRASPDAVHEIVRTEVRRRLRG